MHLGRVMAEAGRVTDTGRQRHPQPIAMMAMMQLQDGTILARNPNIRLDSWLDFARR